MRLLAIEFIVGAVAGVVAIVGSVGAFAFGTFVGHDIGKKEGVDNGFDRGRDVERHDVLMRLRAGLCVRCSKPSKECAECWRKS